MFQTHVRADFLERIVRAIRGFTVLFMVFDEYLWLNRLSYRVKEVKSKCSIVSDFWSSFLYTTKMPYIHGSYTDFSLQI